jgi:hypothetical protein
MNRLFLSDGTINTSPDTPKLDNTSGQMVDGQRSLQKLSVNCLSTWRATLKQRDLTQRSVLSATLLSNALSMAAEEPTVLMVVSHHTFPQTATSSCTALREVVMLPKLTNQLLESPRSKLPDNDLLLESEQLWQPEKTCEIGKYLEFDQVAVVTERVWRPFFAHPIEDFDLENRLVLKTRRWVRAAAMKYSLLQYLRGYACSYLDFA